jgi:hypothetical protein
MEQRLKHRRAPARALSRTCRAAAFFSSMQRAAGE